MLSVGSPVYLQPSLTSSLVLCDSGATYTVSDGRVMVPGSSSSSSSMSPKSTGATVHHLGPTDPTDSPFAHLRSQLQSVTVPDGGRPSVSIATERQLSTESSADADLQPHKRIKLDPSYNISLPLSTPLSYRLSYVKSRERELSELRSLYQEHITELFFLQNSGNLMDYVAWTKRPNSIHLNRVLQSTNLDNTDGTKQDDEVCHV